MDPDKPKVLLIGGAPLIGKTSVARKVAAALEYACISTDDLGQAAQMLTTALTHPALHYQAGMDYREYFTSRTIVQLIVDSEHYQEALWPGVEKVILNHAAWGAPAVIEGWLLQPEKIAKLAMPELASFWLVGPEETYHQRLQEDAAFLEGVHDIEKFTRHFIRRSLWYDHYIRKIAQVYHLAVIVVPPGLSASELSATILDTAAHATSI